MKKTMYLKRRVSQLIIAAFISLFVFMPKYSFGENINQVSSFVKTPQELSLWLLNEFEYVREIKDSWQKAPELLASRKGDCEDFAILSQELLKAMGIKSHILIIKFKGLNQSHAVCIWEQNGRFSFISNQRLIQTDKTSLIDVIEAHYSDWEQLIFTNANKQFTTIVTNGINNTALEQKISVALGNR
ncbi:MAG: transglutaminase-like domain-containing protein [Candidatus Omnitrophota bacterium]